MSEFTLALVSLIPASFFNSTTAAAVLVVNSPVKSSGLIPLPQNNPDLGSGSAPPWHQLAHRPASTRRARQSAPTAVAGL